MDLVNNESATLEQAEEFMSDNYAVYRIVHGILSADCKPLDQNISTNNAWIILKNVIIREETNPRNGKGKWIIVDNDIQHFEEAFRVLRKFPTTWKWCSHKHRCALAMKY